MTSRLIALPALAVILLLGSACGSGPADSVFALLPHDIVRAAPDRTTEAGSFRMAITQSTTMMDLETAVAAEGALDADSGRFWMETEAEGGPVELIVAGATMYVRAPLVTEILETKPWLQVELNEMAAAQGVEWEGIEGLHPTAQLEVLRRVADDVEELGRESVRGVETTHYVATTEFAALVGTALGDESAEFEATAEAAGLDIDEVMIDLWIDDEGLLRRMRSTMEGATDEGAFAFSMDAEFFDYGATIEIALPDPDEVDDLNDLGF